MTEQENKPVTLWTNDAHLSDRDQFAMEFAKWVSDRYMYNNVSDTWLSLQGNTYTTSEKIFDLYKKSLTKTDKV